MQFGIEHLYHDSVTNNTFTELPLELPDFPLRRDFIKELLEVVISGSLLF
jgi:hypothetical protein